MHQANILRMVVASPSDVQSERNALDRVLEELNHGIAGERGLRLELARWETDAFPGFHADGPQGLIDAILRIDNCDVLICHQSQHPMHRHNNTAVGRLPSGLARQPLVSVASW
jgi:hypothetical protein